MTRESFVVYFGLINVFTFVVRGVDKRKAVRRGWRISEKNLLKLIIFGGGIGALVGIQVWRHKTLKGKFLWKVYGLIAVWLVLGIYLLSTQ